MIIMNTNHQIVMQEIHSIHLFVFNSFLTMSHICYTFVAPKTKGTCVLACNNQWWKCLKDPGIDWQKKNNTYNIPKNSQKTLKI
jgi:hypothetical protein